MAGGVPFALQGLDCLNRPSNQTEEIHMSVTEESAGATAIRPFTIPITPVAELEALRTRITATRWPDKELVTDHSQGPQLTVMQELARYWAAEYDWRKCEAKLNALPHFMTEIDGRRAPVACRPPHLLGTGRDIQPQGEHCHEGTLARARRAAHGFGPAAR
jgi:hypothetical protein